MNEQFGDYMAISRGLALFRRISGPFAELQIIKSTMGPNLWGHLEDTEQTSSVTFPLQKFPRAIPQ